MQKKSGGKKAETATAAATAAVVASARASSAASALPPPKAEPDCEVCGECASFTCTNCWLLVTAKRSMAAAQEPLLLSESPIYQGEPGPGGDEEDARGARLYTGA